MTAAAAPAAAPAAEPEAELTPPTLRRSVPARYPREALRERKSAAVTVELSVDENGRVTDAKVTSPAGHGFDDAALLAARELEFEPARRNGRAIAATIDFTFEFQPPPEAAAADAPARLEQREDVAVASGPATLVVAERPQIAASASTVAGPELTLRPRGSVGDLLRVTPGLVVVQHSGGGKANQYFLRGFDADHGTDVALSFDGVPINMPSHAHGQGYADTSFIIPELVDRVEIRKGPYFVELGDFATAGAINLASKDRGERTTLGVGFEASPGHGTPGYRALWTASPKLGKADALFAADVARTNGPFEHPNRWDKYRLFNKVTYRPNSDVTLSASWLSYAGNWHGSGQIPERAIQRGLVSRFGALDPSEGGASARHQLALNYRARDVHGNELAGLAYLGRYRLRLFSNFTYLLSDPERGDQIEQDDARTFYGAKLSYRVPHHFAGMEFATTLGAEARNDDVAGELWHSAERERLEAVKRHELSETLLSAYLNEQVRPTRWLRLELGARADLLTFDVTDRLQSEGAASGSDAARQLSPKGSAVVELLNDDARSLHLFANYGHGFHSNDVRGAFASPRVAPLARAVGAEVGARARLFRRWRIAAAAFRLDLASETVWVGDEGTTESAGASTRRGIELENRLDLTSFLSADFDVTFTKSELRANAGNGNGLALAAKQTWAGGLSARGALGPGQARAALRFFGVGERPATDDGAIVVPGYTELDLALGYTLPRFDLALDVENLLNASYHSAAFATVTRLAGEPGVGGAVPAGFGCGSNARFAAAPAGGSNGRFYGCEDLAFTPANPLTVRLMATLFLD